MPPRECTLPGMGTLYHYVHCPFCIRIRMTCGFLPVDYKSVILSYDDEGTPVELTGKKMLPIWKDNGKILNESMDIISHIDGENILKVSRLLDNGALGKVDQWLKDISDPLYKMAMPYFIYTPEFNESSREYFRNKKEASRGPFAKLVRRSEELGRELYVKLERLEEEIHPWFLGEEFSLCDIFLASHLWGMYVVPEFQFSNKIHDYLQRVGAMCRFNYHEDYWRQD